MLFNYKRKAKSVSYKTVNGKPYKRKDTDIKGLVIHYTGGTKDTAKNECDFFATGNTRSAGAHCFIGYDGKSGWSIPRNYVAWSVGDNNGRGEYYGKLTNANTISIELCAIANKDISAKQLKKLKSIVKHYAKHCPNISYIVRHYDITTKLCPARYCNNRTNDKKWKNLQSELMLVLKKSKKSK